MNQEYKSIGTRLYKLKVCKDLQCSDGNWNCNPYMLGLANGLILASYIMTDEQGKCPYLNPPEKWLDDVKLENVDVETRSL